MAVPLAGPLPRDDGARRVATPAEAPAVAATLERAPFVCLLNRRAGKGEAQAVRERIAERLRAAGRDCLFVELVRGRHATAALAHAAKLLRQHQGICVAVGGDGTISAAARIALDCERPLAVVAQGTFNLFALEHGLPTEPEAAIEALLQGQPRRVQIGRANGVPFLVNASLGWYPQLLEDREAFLQRTRRRRLLAIAASAVLAVRGWRQLAWEAEQGGKVRTPSLFVANTRVQLARLGMTPSLLDQLQQQRLIGLHLPPISTWALLGLILRGAIGRLGDAEHIERFAFQRLSVHPPGRHHLKVALDGEVMRLRTPLTIEVCPQALTLWAPPTSGAADA